MMISMVACCQSDQTFDKPAYFNAGFYLNGILYTTIPSAGQADWNTLLNKPATFPPALHDHNLLYKPITYIPTWAEITGKPALFDGKYSSLTGIPITFPPSVHTHDWAAITGKPPEIELINELPNLAYLPPPQKTTAEINALVIPTGVIAMVWDKTLGVLKIWDGTKWKTMIANQ